MEQPERSCVFGRKPHIGIVLDIAFLPLSMRFRLNLLKQSSPLFSALDAKAVRGIALAPMFRIEIANLSFYEHAVYLSLGRQITLFSKNSVISGKGKSV